MSNANLAPIIEELWERRTELTPASATQEQIEAIEHVINELDKGRLRVATKFVNVAKAFYAEQGRQVDIIKLYGSMELAPLVGLADKIIDVVDTGNTLRANGLEPQEMIATISSRLIVNKASMKMQHARIQALIETLREAVEAHQHA